jgi:hypothetical protein
MEEGTGFLIRSVYKLFPKLMYPRVQALFPVLLKRQAVEVDEEKISLFQNGKKTKVFFRNITNVEVYPQMVYFVIPGLIDFRVYDLVISTPDSNVKLMNVTRKYARYFLDKMGSEFSQAKIDEKPLRILSLVFGVVRDSSEDVRRGRGMFVALVVFLAVLFAVFWWANWGILSN